MKFHQKFLTLLLIFSLLPLPSCRNSDQQIANVVPDVPKQPIQLHFLGYNDTNEEYSLAANSRGLICNLLNLNEPETSIKDDELPALYNLIYFEFSTMSASFAPTVAAELAKGGRIFCDEENMYIFQPGSVTRSDMNGLITRTVYLPHGSQLGIGAVVADDAAIYFMIDSDYRSSSSTGYLYRVDFNAGTSAVVETFDTNTGAFSISGFFGQNIIILRDTGHNLLSIQPENTDGGERFVATTNGRYCLQYDPSNPSHQIIPFEGIWIDDITSFMGENDYYLDPFTSNAYIINSIYRTPEEFRLRFVRCILGTGDIWGTTSDLTNTVYDRNFSQLAELFPVAVNEKYFAIIGAVDALDLDYSSQSEAVPTITLVDKKDYLSENGQILTFNYSEINENKKYLTKAIDKPL